MTRTKHKSVKFSAEEMAYDGPTELDLAKMIPIIGRGIAADEVRGGKALKATYAVVDDRSVAITLDDGRYVSAPLDWYPRLKHGNPGERNSWKLIMDGRAVLWRTLGIGISVKALFEGTKSPESEASLKKWLATRTAQQRRTA